MHKFLILFITTFSLLSCNQNKHSENKTLLKKYDKNGKLIVYNIDVYVDMWIKNKNLDVTVIDTFYINQKARALKDIKNGKLIYFGFHPREFEKLTKMLSKYGIEAKEHLAGCVRIGGFNPYGYEDEMYDEINKRFGENFIDSLYRIAQKEYITQHPNEEYVEDGEDLRAKYLIK